MAGTLLAASFSGGSGVTVNSTAVTNATTISLNVSVSLSATKVSYTLNLVNGDGGPVTEGGALTVDAAPTVIVLTPSNLGQGASNQTVTIMGTSFVSGSLLAASFGRVWGDGQLASYVTRRRSV